MNEKRHQRTEHEQDYMILSHQQRIDIIYENIVHNKPMRTIAKYLNERYTTVRTIIRSFKKNNRTNRLLNYWTKVTIMNKRNAELDHLNRQTYSFDPATLQLRQFNFQ